ncbi:hypothetical protein EI983_08900 [Roseovarius faecimaris]|uniref:BON domain-containing protein n=1 Tax=Roseovarius faecimaris TaxID=2494550 RepID=A0A6I6IR79_9RHOB|nr:hypothetical protein [Roseovarius faecimaris]QGX98391.1 hypothetical protein EI983_08900 [Roseovarius faecimaris]
MSGSRTYRIEDFFGALLLIAALFALGLFNFKSDAPLVEAGIIAQADSIVSKSVHGMRVSLDGRHITVQGLADSESEKAEILDALRGIEGRGRVRARVTVLEPMIPFRFVASLGQDGAMRLEGATPTEAFRAALSEDHGAAAEALTLASGAPDTDWAQVASRGLRALEDLASGRLELEDRALRLTGKALTPEVAARAELLLADLPESYTLTIGIDALDDGTPVRLTATRSGGETRDITGKLPAEMAVSGLAGELTASPLPLPFDGWDMAVTQGLAALEALHNGHLAIIGSNLTLTGEAWSDAAHAAAEKALAGLPAEMMISTRIMLADSGAPFGLSLTQDEGTVRAEGKVPQSLAPAVLAALTGRPIHAEALEVARISPGDDWWQAASLGAEAIGWIESGQMTFDGEVLRLEGRVQDPPALHRLEQRLEGLPGTVQLDLQIALIDDGSPMRLVLAYDGSGAVLDGKLPEGWQSSQVAEWLGAKVADGDLVHTPKPGPARWPEAAESATRTLALFERGRMALIGTQIAFTGVVRNPAREREVLAALDALPEGYQTRTEIRFQDDGRPFGFVLRFDGTRGTLSGKVPSDLGPASQSAILGAPIAAEGLDFAGVPADADWWSAARAGVKALAELRSGELQLDAYQMVLTGRSASAGAEAAIRARLAPFQEGFKITIEIVAE